MAHEELYHRCNYEAALTATVHHNATVKQPILHPIFCTLLLHIYLIFEFAPKISTVFSAYTHWLQHCPSFLPYHVLFYILEILCSRN